MIVSSIPVFYAFKTSSSAGWPGVMTDNEVAIVSQRCGCTIAAECRIRRPTSCSGWKLRGCSGHLPAVCCFAPPCPRHVVNLSTNGFFWYLGLGQLGLQRDCFLPPSPVLETSAYTLTGIVLSSQTVMTEAVAESDSSMSPPMSE